MFSSFLPQELEGGSFWRKLFGILISQDCGSETLKPYSHLLICMCFFCLCVCVAPNIKIRQSIHRQHSTSFCNCIPFISDNDPYACKTSILKFWNYVINQIRFCIATGLSMLSETYVNSLCYSNWVCLLTQQLAVSR